MHFGTIAISYNCKGKKKGYANENVSIYARGNTIIRQFNHCSTGVKLYTYHSYCCGALVCTYICLS